MSGARALNEPVWDYAPGSDERGKLTRELEAVAGEKIEIPCVIGGKRVKTGKTEPVVMPHDHKHVLGLQHLAGPAEVAAAADAAAAARKEWAHRPLADRAAIFLKAADLLASKHRMRVNASTMHNQSKSCHQAEIDAVCELVDFFRFNVAFAEEIARQQPISVAGVQNRLEYRGLEGFVLAVTPFNFTSIAVNLCAAPALMGCTTIWKPAESQALSAWYTLLLLEEAGLPPGVINFLPGEGPTVSAAALARPDFGGLHFTGSTTVFQKLWGQIGERIASYRSYPRIVGETGGKDFIVAHPSADDAALTTAIVRGSFEYQGQKCSAASRLYIAESTWARIKDKLVDTINSLKVGPITDYSNFMGAVINQRAFDKHAAAIAAARKSNDAKILAGGECDDKVGWFVRPTLIQTTNPKYQTMCEELFGPIVTAYVYPDKEWPNILDVVDGTSPYALTGAIFASDKGAVAEATRRLSDSAGNFYINDKPTGAVVGQQPFGGARGSGTNDKAGSMWNLIRWSSPRTIKENLQPPTDHQYPYMG